MANNIAVSAELNRPPEIEKLLEQVKELLDVDKPQEAISLLSREGSAWARNARAVCLLRLGQASSAVDALRDLVVSGHLNLKKEAPMEFKTNFATALLLTGNIEGGIGVLDDLRDEQHPEVQKLRAAVQKWKASMSFWQRLRWRLGGEPSHSFAVDFSPGAI